MTDIEICTDCAFGHYHDYNGVVLCASCGQPKDKPGGVPLIDRAPMAPVKKTTATRKRRTTDE